MKNLSLMALALAALLAQRVQAGEALATLDLTRAADAAQVQATWRYSDARVVATQFLAVGADGQPSSMPNETQVIEPRAGRADFDDSSWPVIGAETLKTRRGAGRVSFNWYRLSLTLPDAINGVSVAGKTVWFDARLDDYAEIWVNGEIGRGYGQMGGSVVAGWSAPNRVVLAHDARAGQQIQVAVFGMNGPISDAPTNYIYFHEAKLSLADGAPGPVAVTPHEVNVRIERVDPAIDRIVPLNAKLWKLAEGFRFTEGPVWVRDGGYLLFSDPNANRIYKYSDETGLGVFRERSGYDAADIADYGQPGSNGLTLDRQGRLTLGEHGRHRVSRIERDGSVSVIASHYQGKRLNSPNDLVYRSDGSLYFTDPPFGLPKFGADPRKELPFSGVYRVTPAGKLSLLSQEFTGPNGIAFSPDEKFLYVGNWDPGAKLVKRYPVKRDGSVGPGAVFVDLTQRIPGDEALDGIKVDKAGNVYLSAPGGVWIFDATGKHLGTIVAPSPVHNFAWGGADGKTLYLCARSNLYRIPLLIEGVRPMNTQFAPDDGGVATARTQALPATPITPSAAAAPSPLPGRDSLSTADAALSREWLVANGLGGFAAGTVGLANTRRYHGLLVASFKPPVDRLVLVSKVDIAVNYRGENFSLTSNEFVDGTLAGRGFERLVSFELDGQIPVWTFAVADALIELRIHAAHGENTSYLRLRVLAATGPISFELTPLCAYRDYHSHIQGTWQLGVDAQPRGVTIRAFDGAHPYHLRADRGSFTPQPDWYWNFLHRVERDRGLDAQENLFRPGLFHAELAAGESLHLTATAESGERLDGRTALLREMQRTQRLLRAADPGAPAWIKRLHLAADQYIVSRADAMGSLTGKTVIAGYPWFADWGRDTMIALPGLTLATGRHAEAAAILRTFGQNVSQGMLPNRFPDGGETPEYNTVDATLWYFHALDCYFDSTRDVALLAELMPVMADILDWHARGTRYGIAVDPVDGLLRAGVAGVQLTWMDAKVGDWVVTPRIGKPVEINALWHFAHVAMARWNELLEDGVAALAFAARADRIRDAFRARFWNSHDKGLFDVIDGPDQRADTSVRPNQIFAVSLGAGLLYDAQARSVVEVCARELLTPVGLRSLARDDRQYVAQFRGGPLQRDGAYHQGTVWSWLLGPFALAHHAVHGDAAHALGLLAGIAPHLQDACIGQISEVFDADAPHAPGGCFAQAWGVSETLRAYEQLRKAQHG